MGGEGGVLLIIKMNTTFFHHKLGAEYFFIRLFCKRARFSEKVIKNFFCTVRPLFRKRSYLTLKMNEVSFHKLGAEYFFIGLFFRKKQYFLRKLRKTIFEDLRSSFHVEGVTIVVISFQNIAKNSLTKPEIFTFLPNISVWRGKHNKYRRIYHGDESSACILPFSAP